MRLSKCNRLNILRCMGLDHEIVFDKAFSDKYVDIKNDQ